eukprot:TRINITY_DN300_c0_g2_i1.p1 TRINITY_DN300_c0_g2~~TRINITY_DN300_c0_g2_i1.p1  ORF type:complete len:330 (-),score=52.15 TRINITY_DN300_c0_g2_i1:397-1386(-)
MAGMAATAVTTACTSRVGRARANVNLSAMMAVVAAGRVGFELRFGSSSEACWSRRELAVPPSVAAEAWGCSEEEEEEQSIGHFCLLYSPLRNLAPARTRGRPGVVKSRGRNRHVVEASGKASNGGLLGAAAGRWGEVARETKETQVSVNVNLDGTGICNCDTGIPFLDHMLDQLSSHGLFDLEIKAKGDLHIDDHHTNEDVALALGTAVLKALGDRKGITRFGNFSAPLDEALVHVVLDLSGRPFLAYEVDIPTERVGTYDTQLVEHFFQSLVNTSGMTLHIRQLAGKNSHHIIEATFKAFARALRQATEFDARRQGSIPSSKGVLSRA